MTQPENFTAAQASDPQTPGQVLADIAALRPDLRAIVASNPSAYPGLLEWLKSLGEPAVDAAIAARPAAGQVTQQMPVQPPLAPQGVQVPPAPAWAGQATPGAPAYGPPQGMPPQGMPPQGMPPQGMPMGGYGPGAPAPRKSNKTALWVILGIVALIILLGVGAVIFFLNRAKDVVDDIVDDIDITDLGDGDSYGDDAALDALWDACEDEDWEACDSLFMQAPVGSEYEDFGDTCGNRTDGSSFCTTEFGGGTEPTDSPNAYGDDASLDALWDACSAEDWEACDSLYMAAPIDSEYETYGDTCGNRTDGSSSCTVEFGSGTTTTEPYTYGDDAALDALWDLCTGEDWQACDDLYLQSAVGSDYEYYGDTCGNKYEAGTTNYCVDVMP